MQAKTTEQSSNRILHMNTETAEKLKATRAKAVDLGVESRLDFILDYVRKFGLGPEEHWKTTLYYDIPFNHTEMNYIAVVEQRIGNGKLIHYMTMGVIWDRKDKDWSTHS